VVNESTADYLKELTRISKQRIERELEIIAKKEGNSIEVQAVKKEILKTRAGSWFGTIVRGYLLEKYYKLTKQI